MKNLNIVFNILGILINAFALAIFFEIVIEDSLKN
jgi:hypothetical protein